jgi:2-C-methyl-D-erythritol 4-phosphate cytidylyltransferase / 2-C-methyl-D-erythritol 2,4-cyclodiphosphate synthase
MKISPKRTGAIIVAAGRGERAGDPQQGPKQYRAIGGSAVLSWTLQPFLAHERIASVVVVIHPDDEALYRSAVQGMSGADRVLLVFGGNTRQISVKRGLEALEDPGVDHVLIHDGVRPFVDGPLIDRVLDALSDGALASLPAVPVADTLKECDASGRILRTVSRHALFAAQTPQGFAFERIMDAHRRAEGADADGFTDDASIAEWAGMAVCVVDGDPRNVKLTLREDLVLADERLSLEVDAMKTFPDIRTGNGYDVHALVQGDGVTLCGVFIEHDRSLSGHSDADVGYHALTDALLATCGAGDIGDHFPPSDPQWKGAPSRIFLREAVRIVRENHGFVTNADISLICEAPRVGPHRAAMRAAMARDLEIDIDRCSVKATTNEKIGFVGRGEGIAAIATATVFYRR